MEVILANSYGFCFGVKRAIQIAQEHKNSTILGKLIHNDKEIERLEREFGVTIINSVEDIKNLPVIIRTHGIPKGEVSFLKNKNIDIIDATCPFVKNLQQICEKMSDSGYDVVIFGDKNHPEVKGVVSYVQNKIIIAMDIEEVAKHNLSDKVAFVSQTTRKVENFLKIASHLIEKYKEVRVFNTICNATSENQQSAKDLSKEVDIMIVIGGKDSSNTKQLFTISKENCIDSFLVEDEKDLNLNWFIGKKKCGITAGASTPDWIIDNVVCTIKLGIT